MGSIPTFGTYVLGVRLTVVDGSEAEVICGLLRSAGIACNHRQTDVGIATWESTGFGGPGEVLVGEHDLEAAKKVVTGSLGSA